jgi:Branched-chain amino acid ATP-binding cassette transporter
MRTSGSRMRRIHNARFGRQTSFRPPRPVCSAPSAGFAGATVFPQRGAKPPFEGIAEGTPGEVRGNPAVLDAYLGVTHA